MNKQAKRRELKNIDYLRVKTSQGKIRERAIQSPFNVFPHSPKIQKRESLGHEVHDEYFLRKSAKQENKNTINHSEKTKNRLKTEGTQYDRLHQKLESIETRISEMKMSLQKKREEKQKRQRFRIKMEEQDNKYAASKQQANQKKKQKNQEKKNSKDSTKNLQDYITQQKQRKVTKKLQQEELRKENSKSIKKSSDLKGFVTQVPETKARIFQSNPYSPRSSTYYVSEIIKGYKDEGSLVKQHIKTSLDVLRQFQNVKLPSKQIIANKAVKLSRRKGYENKKTIIFDLDETLIHCNENLEMEHQVKLPIKFPTGDIIEAGINIRPGVDSILKALNKNFEVIVFTASHPCYANVVIDYLDPTGELIHHRLFREHCYLVTNHGPYVKDLRIINRQLSKMVLVDNAAYSYAFQLDNGVPILPYYHGKNDYQLKMLQEYLEKYLFVDDVRAINRNTFKFRQYRDFNHHQELVQKLYMGNK